MFTSHVVYIVSTLKKKKSKENKWLYVAQAHFLRLELSPRPYCAYVIVEFACLVSAPGTPVSPISPATGSAG